MADTEPSEKVESLSDEKTEPSAEKKTAPAKKPTPELKSFVDNGNGTVTDPNTGLVWKKTDAWLDTHKFYTWQAHRDYVNGVNKEKFAGYDNWRIPSKGEAVTLVDKTGSKQCEDKNGTMFPIDPIFDAGCVSNTWILECSDEKIIRFDLKIGIDTAYPGQDVWGSVRLVSKPGEASAKIGEEPDSPKSEVQKEKPTGDAPAPSSTPTAKAKPAGSAPRPAKRDVTEEEKAIFKARAKAWAEKKKK
ncbi:MAG TPA: DUF1566 domain-containing protein [Nitrospinaceae bacterium]|nr:DUF1566 domain-containing protein [Nitrospinaceae bacterium]